MTEEKKHELAAAFSKLSKVKFDPKTIKETQPHETNDINSNSDNDNDFIKKMKVKRQQQPEKVFRGFYFEEHVITALNEAVKVDGKEIKGFKSYIVNRLLDEYLTEHGYLEENDKKEEAPQK